MPQVGPLEILVIFVVALLVFGPAKLPELGRQVGRGLRELRRLQENLRRDLDEVLDDDDEPGRPPTLPPRAPGATERRTLPPPPSEAPAPPDPAP
jgi:TatA/E family protein of Tat protein translocase